MSPKVLKFPYVNSLHPIEEENLSSNMFTISYRDYIIIKGCEQKSCNECECFNISNIETLKICLNEEKRKNEKYNKKMNQFVRKYQQLLRQLKYQQSRIEKLTKIITDSKDDNIFSKITASDFSAVEAELQEDFINDSKDAKRFSDVKLEFL